MDPLAKELIEWIFKGLVGSILVFAVNFLRDISKSINQLNVSVATILEHNENYDRALSNHETRIEKMESSSRRKISG